MPVASRQAGGGAVVRLLTGENRPGFCKLSKSRIDRDRNGREYVGRLGASAGAGWGAYWPGAVLGWPFGGGVRSIYDFDGKTAGKRAQVLIFSPFLPSCSSSPSSDVLAFSCWLCLFDLGGQAGGIGAAGGVSIWPGCWAYGRRSQANRLANRQNAQRFNKKCSIMTKIMPCISCFLRCKYAYFGVK